jgi:hypothetical protein
MKKIDKRDNDKAHYVRTVRIMQHRHSLRYMVQQTKKWMDAMRMPQRYFFFASD